MVVMGREAGRGIDWEFRTRSHELLYIEWLNYKVLMHSKGNYIQYLVIHNTAAAAAAKSLQSCPTLCNPIGGSPPGSPPGSPVPGILQARTLEWVAISFSKA